MSLLITSDNVLVGYGLSVVMERAGLHASAVAIQEAELLAEAATLIVYYCDRWDTTTKTVVYRLRAAGAPLIVLGPQINEAERRESYRAGCLDFVKSDNLEELVLKTTNLVRTLSKPTSMVQLGQGRHLDLLRRRVIRSGRVRDIPDKELRLFLVLYEEFRIHPGQPVSCETLTERIWGASDARAKTTLRSHIDNLRDRIEDEPQAPAILIGVRSEGYRLNLPGHCGQIIDSP